MNNNVRAIVQDIKDASREEGVQAWNLTLSQFKKHSNLTEWSLRKVGGFNSIKNLYFPMPEKDLATIQQQKDLQTYVSKLEKQLGSKFLNDEKIEKILSNIKPVKVTPFKSTKKKIVSRIVNVIFSDLHIGSDLNGTETGGSNFGKVEESRRLARLTEEIVSYKKQYRDHTQLNLVLLGDIIQNALHDPRDGAPVAEQCCRAIYLLSQSIAHLAASFPKVKVYCNTGNHGRNTARHHGRATNQKWDSLESIVYYALKNAMAGCKNVSFEIPLTPYVQYQNFGSKLFFTHGDSVLDPGYPGKAIKTGSLEQQINRINSSLPDSEEYSVFAVGHVHSGSITHLGNGSVMITNGAMVPSDQYSVSIGHFENQCGQYLFESVEGYPVGDCRFIKVGRVDDTNANLDKIIKPFEGL